jgi:hypothetical protein
MAIKWANFVATCLDSYEQLQPRYVEKLLTPDIPNGPCSMFWIRDVLNIESNCWNCRDHFAQFQLVQHRRLPRCIEAHHHDPVLLTPKQPFCKTYYFVKRRKKAHVLQVVIRKAKIKRRTTNTIDQWFLSSTPKKNCELNIFFPLFHSLLSFQFLTTARNTHLLVCIFSFPLRTTLFSKRLSSFDEIVACCST